MSQTPTPPHARQIPHVEHRHGGDVVDPFYWLREKANPEVTAYLQQENSYTEQMTSTLKPLEQKLYAEMLGRIKQTDLSVPVRQGDFLYYTRYEEGKQYPIRCRRKGNMDAPEQVLLDLNQLAAGKPFVGLGEFVVSDDQNLLAYTVDFSGFRQYTLQVKNLVTGETLADSAERVTGAVWAADNRTIFYTTEDAVTKRSDTVWRHPLGSTSAAVFEEPDELFDVDISKTRDHAFIFVEIESKDTTEFRYLRASEPNSGLQVFLPRRTKHRYYPDHHQHQFLIRTNRSGINFEIAAAPDNDFAEKNWTVVVPYRKEVLIEDMDVFRDFLAVIEKSQALTSIRIRNFSDGSSRSIPFPEPVYSASPGDNREYATTSYRYTYQSFITPQSVYDYDTVSGTSQLLKRKEVPGGYDAALYASERLWITARDGVKVPVSVVYRKGWKRDGTSPLLLYGYGSYGIAIPVTFDSDVFSLLDRGYAYAIAHIRGGNDLGEEWRESGMLMHKKNTFNDFVDTAQYLVNNQWTSPSKLEIEGGSAGGLLMGVVVNQRPDLFRAVHFAVPFVDVMNTMMDASLPLTVGEYLEWGNPNEQAAYEYMNSYSPYDNLKKGSYPAMLVTTSLNDSQVMYWEPAKYVAKLRTLKTDSNELLLKTKMEPAGHGGASGRYDKLRDRAFEYAWFLQQVGIAQ